jgi:CBS domain-containing protein
METRGGVAASAAVIRPSQRVAAMNVDSILRTKGGEVVTTRPDVSIADIARLLHGRRIGAVVVLSEGGGISGMAEHGEEVSRLTVGRLMTREVVTCAPGDTIRDVMTLMTHRRVRHVPVVEADRLVGIVSIGDVVKSRIEETEVEVDSLRDYVMNTR